MTERELSELEALAAAGSMTREDQKRAVREIRNLQAERTRYYADLVAVREDLKRRTGERKD